MVTVWVVAVEENDGANIWLFCGPPEHTDDLQSNDVSPSQGAPDPRIFEWPQISNLLDILGRNPLTQR